MPLSLARAHSRLRNISNPVFAPCPIPSRRQSQSRLRRRDWRRGMFTRVVACTWGRLARFGGGVGWPRPGDLARADAYAASVRLYLCVGAGCVSGPHSPQCVSVSPPWFRVSVVSAWSRRRAWMAVSDGRGLGICARGTVRGTWAVPSLGALKTNHSNT